MNSQVTDISSTKKRLTVHVPREVVSSEVNAAFNEVNRTVKVPGFRPGKVPRNVLEKRFGKEVRAQVLEKLFPEAYGKALRDNGLHPVTTPVFESSIEVDPDKPLDVTMTVEVRPEIPELKYEGLEVEDIPRDPTEEEINHALEAIRKERGTLEPAETAEADAHVTLDYEAFEGEESLPEVSDKDLEFDLDSDHLPEEFARETRGRKAGDRYEVTVSYPEDHPGEKVAGKTVTFKVHLKEIKKRVLPELDDAFAKETGFDSFEALRTGVVNNVRRMKERQAFEVQRAAASEKILENHDFELPESLFENEMALCVQEAQQKQAETVAGKTDKEIREMVRPDAVRNVKGRMLMDMIGEKEGITVTEEDMRRKLAEVAAYSGIHPEALLQYYGQNKEAVDQLRQNVFETKTFERIISKAKLVKREG